MRIWLDAVMAMEDLLIQATEKLQTIHSRHKEEIIEQRKVIGKLMKDIRENAGVSVQELAKALGCSRILIYQYESGDSHNISPARASAILSAFTRGKK